MRRWQKTCKLCFFFSFIFLTQVTGYEGYGKKSFIELPNTNKASSSKQSSSSADEEPVKIVIKEDISKRPSSKKSSPKKSSPKETSSKKSSSKKSSS